MNRLAVAFIVALTSGVGFSQEMPSNVREHIEQHYLGEWNFSMKSENGAMKGSFTAKWAPGKQCVLVKQVSNGPEGKLHTTGVLAWQPDTQTVVHHGFMSNGDYFRILYDKFEENKWSGRVTGLVNGERPDDSDAVAVWMKDRIVYEDAVYRFEAERVEDADLADRILRYFPGTWQSEGDRNGEGKVEWELVADGEAIAGPGMTAQGGGDFGLGGWRSKEKQWVHIWYEGEGGYGESRVDKYHDGTYYGVQRTVDDEGQVSEGKLMITIIDQNHFTITTSSDGEKNTGHWHRQKK